MGDKAEGFLGWSYLRGPRRQLVRGVALSLGVGLGWRRRLAVLGP